VREEQNKAIAGWAVAIAGTLLLIAVVVSIVGHW
jgi:hypothetical protein